MATAKRQREESENEEGEQESDSDRSSDDLSSSSESTDSEGSSELDVDELEKRRSVLSFGLGDVESHFGFMRECLYQERIDLNNQRLDELTRGNAIEYVSPLKALKKESELRFEVLEVLRNLRITSVHNQFEAEIVACKQNLQNEKEYLTDLIQSELLEKMSKLEEDRNTVDVSSEAWSKQFNTKCHKNVQSTQSPAEPRKRKPVTVSGPYIVYMLNEDDIMDDWATIKRAITASKRKSKCNYSPGALKRRSINAQPVA